MFKVLTYLVSFFISLYQSILKPSYLVIIDQLLVRARKMIMTSVLSLVAGLLLTGSMMISLIEFTSQIDKFGVVWPSATLIGGLVLSVISTGALIYSFTSKAFDLRYIRPSIAKSHEASVFGANLDQQTAPSRQPSPLEEALGILVMDFVNERRESRLKDESERTEKSKSSSESSYVAPQAAPESTRSTYENSTLQ